MSGSSVCFNLPVQITAQGERIHLLCVRFQPWILVCVTWPIIIKFRNLFQVLPHPSPNIFVRREIRVVPFINWWDSEVPVVKFSFDHWCQFSVLWVTWKDFYIPLPKKEEYQTMKCILVNFLSKSASLQCNVYTLAFSIGFKIQGLKRLIQKSTLNVWTNWDALKDFCWRVNCFRSLNFAMKAINPPFVYNL
jgi:hypothetical protein